MRKFFIFLALLIVIPAGVLLYGMNEMGKDADDDPMTESNPERLAHRDAYYKECLDGSDAKPDKIYCENLADITVSYYTDTGMIQEALHYGTHGMVPRYYNVPDAREEMRARREASYSAKTHGADGSTRFTGEKYEEYNAEDQRLTAEWMRELGIAEDQIPKP